MQQSGGDAKGLTAQESWQDIHATMERTRSSMYVAGSATILLLWAAIAAVGVGSQSAIMELASEFADSSPWIFGVLWGSLMVPGMVGSGLIGRRAGRRIAPGDAARSAGIRVFLYWMAVVAAMFLIPAAAGMWNAEDGENIPLVTMGIVALGLHPLRYHAPAGVGHNRRGVRRGVLHPQPPPGRRCHAGVWGTDPGRGGPGRLVDTQERGPVTGSAIVLNETIHQSTRLRIMTLLVSMPETDRVAYGFIQKTLDLTGGNLTIHLRKLEDAEYLAITKEFQDSKPHTWVQATETGRRAFAEYLSNLEKALNWQPRK